MKKDKEISRTEKLAQKTDNFLSSNRKLLISILVVILLILAGVGIGITVHSSNVDKKYEELYNLENSYNNLLVIDELDSSLHPLIVQRIVYIFQTPHINTRGAQLLFTTHDISLLQNDPK